MIRTRQKYSDASGRNTDTTRPSRWVTFRPVIEPYLRFVKNLQRRSRERFVKRVKEEKAARLENQSNTAITRRPEIGGAPLVFARGEKDRLMKERSVLIVDDEKNIRLTLVQALEVLGVETDTAADGEEALVKLREKEFGLILLDLRLPGMSGMEVLRQLREIRPDIRVIIMTAYGTVESAVEAMRLGACDYIQKPFIPEEIRDGVSRVMDREKLQEQKVMDYASGIELAKRCIGDRHFDGAVEHVRKAISLDPSRPEAFNLLGTLMELRGDRDEAQKNYRAALSLDPSYRPAIENLERSTSWRPKQRRGLF